MTEGPRVRITVDGKLALTTTQAAERHRVKTVTMRGELRRYGVAPVTPLDERTPLYVATAVDRMMKARPGKGTRKQR
jgi:hypothetical protein